MTSPPQILDVRNLSVSVALPDRRRATVIDDVSFSIEAGGTLGLVGESGSGKTMTGLAIMGLLPPGVRVDAGEILLEGDDLLRKSPRVMQRVRGSVMSMVLQDPLTALDPSFTVRSQLAEPLIQHLHLHGRSLRSAMVTSLEQVHLSAARERLNQYPHQLSGGMRQRVTSAIALAGQPRLLIADEPTTSLDMTTQARYLLTLQELQKTTGFALLFISHDLMVVRHLCSHVLVMYATQIVEEGAVEDVFAAPQHPYTRALIRAIPELADTMRLDAIDGQAPDITDEVTACRFAPRCEFAREVCHASAPELSTRGETRRARCWGTEPIAGWIEAGANERQPSNE